MPLPESTMGATIDIHRAENQALYATLAGAWVAPWPPSRSPWGPKSPDWGLRAPKKLSGEAEKAML